MPNKLAMHFAIFLPIARLSPSFWLTLGTMNIFGVAENYLLI